MKIDMIFGPPGTGKSTRLLDILNKELETVAPDQIAYVSFTKEGANIGKTRAKQRFGLTDEDFPFFRTLHSLAFNELNMRRTSMMAPSHYKHFSHKMGMSFVGYYTEEFTNNDDRYLFFDSLHRNNPRTAAQYASTINTDKLAHVRRNYRRYKDTFALYDFTDLIELFIKRNKSIPVRVAFIDEAQDLTTLQWTMVWIAFKDCERIYIAGDDDQAIYQWSGADVDYFLDIQYTNLEVLRHSYRLPDPVLRFAKKITAKIGKRQEKDYEGLGETGIVTWNNDVSELTINPNETYMFLSRNNVYLKKIEEMLMKQHVVYSYKGEVSVQMRDIKAIQLYEKVRKTRLMTYDDEFNLKRYLKEEYSLLNPWYESFNWEEPRMSYMRDIIAYRTDITTCNINVNTIHGVKGGEADNVVMLLDVTKNVHDNMAKNPDSEHRVFYVGATRARKALHLINANGRYSYKVV